MADLSKNNILTLDPSITAWGWAVVNPLNNMVVDSGCLVTKPAGKKSRIRKGDDRTRRVSELVGELLRIIRRYEIRYICAELPHGSQSAVAAVMIGMVTGVTQTLSDVLEIPLEWYSEGDSKMEVLRKKSATKHEMIEAIQSRVEWRPTGVAFRDEAVADSLAIYLLARHHSPILRFLGH